MKRINAKEKDSFSAIFNLKKRTSTRTHTHTLTHTNHSHRHFNKDKCQIACGNTFWPGQERERSFFYPVLASLLMFLTKKKEGGGKLKRKCWNFHKVCESSSLLICLQGNHCRSARESFTFFMLFVLNMLGGFPLWRGKPTKTTTNYYNFQRTLFGKSNKINLVKGKVEY